ncbi:TorF family putative porin [Rufibacter roseus]|uniref:DUF481 domain-containing protein n=1 Tax=Rufibacter roseus TaxID=1567108 RepID=A0ABW2DLE9_9BACT|nr:hypothetical protein [Rufibacter roseus]
MKKIIGFCLLMSSLATLPALAQTDAADTVTETKKGWWTIGLETANNASFYGRNTATQYPYVAGSLTYTHRSGLWLSAMSYHLFNTQDEIDETDVSAGYSFNVGERFDGTLSYTRFFFGPNTPLIQSVTSNAVSASGMYDWKILYSGLSASYTFGGSNDFFTVLDNSRYIPLEPLWKGKNAVGLDPKISIIAGTQQFSETYTQVTENKKNNGLGSVLDPLPIGGNNGNGNNNTTTTTTTTTKRRFKVINYSLSVPVVFSLGNFDFEPTYRYSIPVNKLEGDESKAQSFYTFNVSYTF